MHDQQDSAATDQPISISISVIVPVLNEAPTIDVTLDELRRHFGNTAEHLHSLAFGEDDREVVTDEETKSISSENTFDQDTSIFDLFAIPEDDVESELES